MADEQRDTCNCLSLRALRSIAEKNLSGPIGIMNRKISENFPPKDHSWQNNFLILMSRVTMGRAKEAVLQNISRPYLALLVGSQIALYVVNRVQD